MSHRGPVAYNAPMPPHITHIALHVRDLERCVAFYRDYCAMDVVHERGEGESRVVWIAEAGREKDFIFVIIPGGSHQPQDPEDFTHLGFACETREKVNEVAAKAGADGRLVWPPTELPYPVGYFCGVRDPDGNIVEFSYGQPLGPGAEPSSAGA